MQKLRSNPNKLLKAAAAALVLLAIAVSLTAYPMPARAQALSTDATLSALTVSPRDITGFSSVRFAYDVGVASTVTEATITATATNSNADVSFDTPDSNNMTDGHQVALSAGRNTVTITVTAEDGSDEQDYTVSVNRGVADNYGWNADADLDGLTAAENQQPAGIWGNGATFWISDVEDNKLYAYNADGTRDASQDFNTLAAANNDTPGGIWSNGVTMWVADNSADRLFAYRMSDKQRDSAKDFTNLATGNGAPSDLWSDGTTMWVSDLNTDQIFAYRMSDRQPDATRGFTSLGTDNNFPGGIWSDGLTMWVGDYGNDKLYAYDMTSRARLESRDFNTLSDANNGQPEGIWSDGTTMWVADYNDHKVYAYNMPPSNDNRLSSLTVSPKNIIGFAADRTSYQVGVASTVTQATITATANHANATLDYSGTDADAVAVGHQVALSDGRNEVTITVTAEDSSTQDYTISINRGVTTPAGWKASDDLDGLIAAGNIRPGGIYANDTTAWVLNRFNPKKIFGYSRSTGARDTTKDFDIDATNPHDMWSDGTTLWVAERDGVTSNLRAYTLATGTPLPSQDFENLTAAGNTDPFGVWSDGTTMWVADSSDTHLYAYDRVTKVRQMDKELSLSGFAWNNIEIDPDGFWMDDTTIWVSAPGLGNDFITLVRAIKRSDGSRDTSRDIPVVAAGSDGAQGIWADDETMLIVDGTDDKVYSFNLPEAPSTDATLSALTLSPRDIIGFDAERTSYQVGVASTVAEATVAATANDANADVSFDPQDSNDMTDGHQVALVAGRNTVTITVTAENGSDEQDYTVSVNQGVSGDYGWNAERDLDGLEATLAGLPFGIWSNSTTIWVVDSDDESAFAYNHDGTRDAAKDFDFDSSHQAARGAWSDGEYVWITDRDDNKLYVYEVATGTRQNSREFDLDTENVGATGVWSDGATIWVADSFANKVFAYALDGGARQDGDDIDLASDNNVGGGIWSDGATIWVSQELETNPKLFAYVLDGGVRVEDRDFNTLQAAGASLPTGLWSDGETMWVADVTENNSKIYAYNMPPSADNRLSDLTVSPKNIFGFDAGRTSYQVGVASTVTQATITATANHANATVDYSGTDVDAVADGHQMDLSEGRNPVTITVTAEDNTTQDYTVSVNRGVTTGFGWNAEHDLDGIIAGGTNPRHLWTNGTTIWVSDITSTVQELHAYNTGGTRDSAKDFNTLEDANNTTPTGIWSNGTTMWVADSADADIYAYSVSTKAQDTTKKFDDLNANNSQPRGIWSNDTTLWVADSADDKIFAYNLSSKEEETYNQFDNLDPENGDPRGIWSDGETMWVSDVRDRKIYAYNMGTKSRDQTKEFDTPIAAGQANPFGITSNGTIMWVSDSIQRKLYAYNLPPPSDDATLSDLTVSPKDIIGFDADRTAYEVGVASTVSQATVTGTPNDPNAGVSYSGTDADDMTDGHQVALSAGRNEVTITVTAENDRTQDYTVSINQGVTDDYGWNAEKDLDGLIAAGQQQAAGIWSNGTTIWVTDPGNKRLTSYNADGTRNSSEDFNALAEGQNAQPAGIWSNGTTMWVADGHLGNLYAYNMSDKQRDTTKDIRTFILYPGGVWSDGTTIWVLNAQNATILAFNISSRSLDSAKEFNTLVAASNQTPRGIWSDRTTMWVADAFGDKVYAYNMSDKQRDDTKDFNTLSSAGNHDAYGLWSDHTTMWITDQVDRKVYSYNKPLSADNTLSTLTVSPKDITGFDPERTSYEVGLASTVPQATVVARATNGAATVNYSGTDADPGTPGHQVDLSAGRNQVSVTVTAQDNTEKNYTVSINRGVTGDYGWKADDDLDGLIAADNRGPRGIWGNSSTFYISDFDDDKVYAYNRDGTRDDTKDFDTTGSTFPNGIWSDGTTLWVADSGSTTLFAYTLSNGNRNTGAEITLANPARGVWGNSTTIWAVNETTDKLEAYQKSDGTDDNDKDITLDSANADPAGIWSDDTTIWVADHVDDKLYAYTLSNGDRDSSKDIDTSGSGNENPRGLWGEGDTIWVTDEDDDRVYSYNLQDQRNSDATLSALITSPRNILRFDADRTAYEVGVTSTVAQATVTATLNDPKASVDYSGTDADLVAVGHQVDLSAGRNEVTVTVTAEDDSTQDYTVSINRGVTDDFGWNAGNDLDGLDLGAPGGTTNIPVGIAEHNGIFWISSQLSRNIFAFQQDGSRLPNRDFTTAASQPGSLWTDGQTLWVTDPMAHKLYAHRLSDGSRQTGKEFNLHSDNIRPAGIWSDGNTIWVADSTDDKLYSYALDGGARRESREFDLHSSNDNPTGIWSDGYTIWVGDGIDDKLYAYGLEDGQRQASLDFTTLSAAQNNHLSDIWSNGSIMWVVDYEDLKVYSYNMPPSADHRLSDLTVSPKNLIGFATDRTSYEVGVASTVAQATVTGTPANPNARVDFSGTDADLNTTGHQVNLSAGRNEVTVTVTAQDGNNTQEYAVSINRGVAADFGWKASDDLDGFVAHELFVPTGIASDGSRFWITTENDLDIFAFNYLGLPDATRNITPDSDNGNPTYMWADATTLFVVDPVDLLVYAYRLSDGAVQNSREFALLSTNSDPTGIWSDGVTAWVADSADHQLYSYNLALRQPDDDKNIDLDGDNTDPAGVASNGATIWVADPTDRKVYAYTLQGGGRVVTKEINTLVNADNTAPSGMWASLDTIWVNDAGDSKTYTYNLPPATTPQQVAADATLSALTISPKDIVRFDPDDTSYEVGVASTVTEATVAATPNAPNAMAFITPTDANAGTGGHQVALSAGRNPVTIRVTSQDGTIRTYRVSINRGVTANFGWKADDDLDGLPRPATTYRYRGLAEHNGIFWISSIDSRTLAAYQQDGSRLPARDISLHSANIFPSYLWTNGTTIWVADSIGDKLFAYRLSDGNRQESGDIALHADNVFVAGIWSDGTTIWVAESNDDKLYAYALDGGARQESREFDLHSSNDQPTGIWSDGYTMWVADPSDDKLYAYFLETGQRRGRLDFDTLRGIGNNVGAGITSNGTTMWVLDSNDRKVYSYNLLLSDDRTLSALTVRPKDIIGFDAERDSYQLGVDSTVTRATVTATANHPGARVTFTPPDASSGTRGHQVDLSAGRNPVTVTVTAENGTTQDYTVSVNRGVAGDYGWNAGNDLDGLATTTDNPVGAIAEHDGIFWIAPFFRGNVLAYRQDGSRLPSRDISRSANANITYMFTDGQTIWAADGVDHKLYAYQLSDDSRQEPKDITLHTDNAQGAGIWSDGTTMWVADNTDHKLYAYSLDGGVRQQSREFDLASGNDESRGIWSDGNTVWVTDSTDQKLYAYTLQDGDRQTGRDFNTLQAVGNTKPLDITSGSNIMWVTDTVDNKVYSYNMPLLPPANVQPAIGDRRIAITWDDPQRSAITGYQYRVSSDDAVSWNPDWTTMPGSNARTTTFTVRNLANTFEHVIEVRALEGAKSSGAARFAATPMGPPSMPLMPENLDTVAGDQTIYLSWHKPVEDPRAPVTSFDARYRPYGSSRSWRNATSVSVEQTPRTLYNQTIEGLDNRQPYEVQAAAVNSVGRSEWATASAVPQAEYRYGPPSDDGNETLDLGPLHASWTDRLNSVTFHPDQKHLNINVIENSCMAPATFRIFWDVQDKAAKEYEADIQTREGAGEVTHQFGTETFIYANTRYEQGYIYGTASLHKSSTLSVRVRARFKPEGWSTWSETADLFCFETENPATSQHQAGNAQQAGTDNSPATGEPAITGAAEVGETLTASTGGITDPDGLASAAFSYQWSRDDGSTTTNISRATTSTYTLQEEDLDLRVSVTVAFTDDEGNDETLTSAAVHVQPPPPLSGAFDSATLPSEHDGSSTFSFEIYFSEEPVLGFEAVRDHVLEVTNGDVASVRRTTQGSNLRWEITVQPDSNDEVTLLLPITANCGDAGAVCTASEKKLLIGAAVFVRGPAASQEQTAANTPATGNPAVTGTARVGQTLSADTSGIADADGLQNATFSHQWVAGDGVTDTDIPGETGAAYVVRPGDAGKMIKVRVSFTDDAGNEETLTSAATAAVAATVPGTPRSLQVQTEGTGELAVNWQPPESNGGSEVTGYRVEWKLAAGSWNTEADVSFASTTETSHTITDLALDTEYAVRVIAANGAGDGPPSAERTETARAQTSEQQESTSNTPATGAPAISGTVEVGETLTADTSGIADEDGLDNVVFTYQWVRNDANISGATASTYTVHNDDAGKSIRVRVSFTDDDGNDESLTSEVVAIPVPDPLTASFDASTVPASHDGSTAFTLEFFFNKEPSLEADAVRDQVLTVTGGDVTGASRTTQGSTLRWEITVQPDGDDDVSVTLPRTTGCADPGAVCTRHGQMLSNKISTTISGPEPQQQQQEEGPTEPPPAPTGLTGTINDDGTITLSWTAPEDDSVTGYQVLRRRPQWGETGLEVYVDDTGSPAATYTDTNTVDPTRYVYRVKARNAAGLSEWSNFVKIDKTNQG